MHAPRSRSFADVVREVREAADASPAPREAPGQRLVEPAGRAWREVEDEITEARARELVQAGAALAWDDCGSLGYGAPVDWVARDEAAALAADGPPVLRSGRNRSARLSAWRADDGGWLVLASMSVRWGRRLD
ncbi:hypothetical protein [Cellulomonas cellasea]|uniref:Uncharacterized protein n=2 Tax=Cellulomonas cellasea TaxID=43670 RepID=A0A0A0B6V8_9CELL|nr:hypothetical protein [Cellulomonas cellasea]KGM02600.1 hypothetical protein Q760_12395 [Cellulomonas cellasea DSM 20118]GEA87785.1 hypothetical protein CCE01nite_17340 [Cellulomonas cellasea]